MVRGEAVVVLTKDTHGNNVKSGYPWIDSTSILHPARSGVYCSMHMTSDTTLSIDDIIDRAAWWRYDDWEGMYVPVASDGTTYTTTLSKAQFDQRDERLWPLLNHFADNGDIKGAVVRHSLRLWESPPSILVADKRYFLGITQYVSPFICDMHTLAYTYCRILQHPAGFDYAGASIESGRMYPRLLEMDRWVPGGAALLENAALFDLSNDDINTSLMALLAASATNGSTAAPVAFPVLVFD